MTNAQQSSAFCLVVVVGVVVVVRELLLDRWTNSDETWHDHRGGPSDWSKRIGSAQTAQQGPQGRKTCFWLLKSIQGGQLRETIWNRKLFGTPKFAASKYQIRPKRPARADNGAEGQQLPAGTSWYSYNNVLSFSYVVRRVLKYTYTLWVWIFFQKHTLGGVMGLIVTSAMLCYAQYFIITK